MAQRPIRSRPGLARHRTFRRRHTADTIAQLAPETHRLEIALAEQRPRYTPPPAPTTHNHDPRRTPAIDPASFVDAIQNVLTAWEATGIGDAVYPANGWPWSLPDSAMTDWVYAFDDGHVWVEAAGDGSH